MGQGWLTLSVLELSSGCHGRDAAAVKVTFTLPNHLEGLHQPRQLTRCEEKRRVRGLTTPCLIESEGLVKENAAGLERLQNHREERTVEIVDDEDDVVQGVAKIGDTRLKVHDSGMDSYPSLRSNRGDFTHLLRVDVESVNLEPNGSQEERVTSPSARKVERPTAPREKIGVLDKPRAGACTRVGVCRRVITRAAPLRHASTKVQNSLEAGSSQVSCSKGAPDAMLADDQDRLAFPRECAESGGDQVDGQEHGVRDVAKANELLRRTHVEASDLAPVNEPLSLSGINIAGVGLRVV